MLVVQAEQAHDVLSFVVGPAALPLDLRELAPIRARWGYETQRFQTFYGYVHHTEPLYVDGEQRIKVICAGASLMLSSGVQRTWRYQSYDSIVRDLAAAVYLSADVEAHSIVWPYTISSGNGWEFLVGLAQKIGYVLTANGTELKFISPDEVYKRNMTSAPLLDLDLFRPIAGLTAEEGLRRRLSYGLDQRTGTMFSTATGIEGTPLDLGTEQVSDFPAEARAIQEGLLSRNRFPFKADAEAKGDPAITQASLVYIQGVAPDYIGQWYVLQVEHDIQGGDYQCFLKLGRRTRYPWPSFTRPGQPVQLRTDPYGEVTGNPPPTVLTNGIWRSGWARRAS